MLLRKQVLNFACVTALIVGMDVRAGAGQDARRIEISKGQTPCSRSRTSVEAGPSLGDILNFHYFPGVECYRVGDHPSAMMELEYFVARPQYTKSNPRQVEFFSTAHYIRGTIYLHHASGLGRHVLAKKEFESALRWDPKHYLSYLELSRVWSSVGSKQQAVTVLNRLVALSPPEEVLSDARKELKSLER